MKRIITMTAYRRPDYTRQVLEALARCRGVADWLLLPNVEPGNEKVISLFRTWEGCESELRINERRLGLNRNTQSVLARAHQQRADITVHLEDDTVPSPDALEYFEWAVQEVLLPDLRAPAGHQITLASGYNRPQSFPDHPDLCRTRPIWTSWGWAVEPKRLGWILSQWCTRNARCFTCRFRSYRPWRREIYPQLSRIQNIGYEKGENRRSPQWYRANHRTPWVAGETSGHFRYSP